MGKFLEENRSEIFKKYTDEELVKDVKNYVEGSGRLNKVLNNFFEELIFESCGRSSKISPMEVLNDDNKLSEIFDYIKTKPKFYTGNDISNLKSYFRNAVSWVRKVANFPAQEAKNIYFRYHDINGEKLNILDTSSGFGSRMSAVLLNNHNYCGFDPNKKLNIKLNGYLSFIKQNNLSDGYCKLICEGSEVLQDKLIGKFDVSFTSPPYFNLETYDKNDNSQSTLNYNNYDAWIEKFAIPTIKNTYLYLKVGGYAMINIKNISKKYPLYDDFLKIFNSIDGFEFVEVFDMNVLSKKNYGMSEKAGDIIPKEPVMVYRKIK